MNALKPTKTEWISFFVLMPLIDFAIIYIIFDVKIWHNTIALIIAFALNYLFGICAFFLNVLAMHKFQQSLPELEANSKARYINCAVTHCNYDGNIWYRV